jgi:hypothetical protein
LTNSENSAYSRDTSSTVHPAERPRRRRRRITWGTRQRHHALFARVRPRPSLTLTYHPASTPPRGRRWVPVCRSPPPCSASPPSSR